jgi:ATP-binding cassette subfamily B protein
MIVFEREDPAAVTGPVRGRPTLRLYLRLLGESRPIWTHMAGLTGLSLVAAVMTLLTPLPLKITIDSIVGGRPLPSSLAALMPSDANLRDTSVVVVVAALLVLLAVGKQLVDLAYGVLNSYAAERLLVSFRARLFAHAQRLSLADHDAAGPHDTIYRIQYDAPAIHWITLDAAIPLIGSLSTLAAMTLVILRIDAMLAMVAISVAPVLYVVSRMYGRHLHQRWRETKDLESGTMAVVQEVLSAVRLVKVFAQEDREHERYVRHATRTLRQQVRLSWLGGSFALVTGVCIALATASVLLIGVGHVQAGRLSLGDLIVVMTYVSLLYTPLQNVSKGISSLQGSLVSAARVFELLDRVPEVADRPDAARIARSAGEITFDRVAFSYMPGRPALSGISVEVPAGARVGITGTTGAGKSTLVCLLLRLYDPSQGRILLDGIDLRDYRLRDLRRQFAMVLQDTLLLSGSIAENIAYARPGAGRAEIVAAARAAHAHDFISRLPHEYDTEVGALGAQLSGGERQRIALARAFLADAPILVLDEPTSAVDVHTEAQIVEAMNRLMEGRTTFMIAHRLSTLAICDVHLHLEHGRLVPADAASLRGVPS